MYQEDNNVLGTDFDVLMGRRRRRRLDGNRWCHLGWLAHSLCEIGPLLIRA